jgi:hypothetical protein
MQKVKRDQLWDVLRGGEWQMRSARCTDRLPRDLPFSAQSRALPSERMAAYAMAEISEVKASDPTALTARSGETFLYAPLPTTHATRRSALATFELTRIPCRSKHTAVKLLERAHFYLDLPHPKSLTVASRCAWVSTAD